MFYGQHRRIAFWLVYEYSAEPTESHKNYPT